MTDQLVESVLIVDDDPIACEMLKSYFQQRGTSTISIAHNGKTALEIVGQSDDQIDLILLDLKMPVMDGIQFLRHMQLRTYKGTIGIMSGESADVMSLAIELATKHGLNVVGPVTKPANATRLDALILASKNTNYPVAGGKSFSPTAAELQIALELRQFVAFYQPIIAADSGEVVGVEALARWNHPSLGIIGPDTFVPLADKSGLMKPFTLQMINNVLHDFSSLDLVNSTLKISINLGAAVLEDTQFPDIAAKAIDEFDEDIGRFIFEITESKLIDDSIGAMEVLARLDLMGFTLSLDDFGTQYSNFEQLTRFPFKELKIDKRFVQSSSIDDRSKATFETCAQLGRRLGMQIVAEGIETDADWSFAKNLGVDKLQGYLFARPMPIDELLLWASTRQLESICEHATPGYQVRDIGSG